MPQPLRHQRRTAAAIADRRHSASVAKNSTTDTNTTRITDHAPIASGSWCSLEPAWTQDLVPNDKLT